MKKKNGFAFIETIVTIVILSAALIYLYSSYSAIITEEERRVYYDDTAFIYYTNYVRKFLEEYADLNTIENGVFIILYNFVSFFMLPIFKNLLLLLPKRLNYQLPNLMIEQNNLLLPKIS